MYGLVDAVYLKFLIWEYYVYRLVSGSGDIKLTKDGNVLLHEMVCILQRASWVKFVGVWQLKCESTCMLKSNKH